MKVALVEKGRIGAEQSSRNWGWCRQQNRDARELPMATKSLELWEQLRRRDRRRHGLSPLRPALSQQRRRRARRLGALARLRAHGRRHDAHAERRRGHASVAARTGTPWKGGVFSPTDGTADPRERGARRRAAPPEARRHRAPGMRRARHRDAKVAALSGVVTENGTIRTKVAVLAGGAWASSFCRQLGIRFPQASVRQSIAAVSPGAEASAGRAAHARRSRSRGAATAATRSPSAGADASILRRSCCASRRSSCRCSCSAGAASRRAACEGIRSRPRNARSAGGSTRRRRWSACASSIRRSTTSAVRLTYERAAAAHARDAGAHDHRDVGRLHRQHARRRAGNRRDHGHSRASSWRRVSAATASASVRVRAISSPTSSAAPSPSSIRVRCIPIASGAPRGDASRISDRGLVAARAIHQPHKRLAAHVPLHVLEHRRRRALRLRLATRRAA